MYDIKSEQPLINGHFIAVIIFCQEMPFYINQVMDELHLAQTENELSD